MIDRYIKENEQELREYALSRYGRINVSYDYLISLIRYDETIRLCYNHWYEHNWNPSA